MKYIIPNLKKIIEPKWAHRVGYGFSGNEECKLGILEQGTTPEDPKLLNKLGIKKGEKILVIAGYYASWASELKKAGAEVDYSDISKSIINWVKKNIKIKFRKYLCSNYELIPEKPREYDWTFTYEACGGGRGLPLAYLRALLNSKGRILVLCLSLKHKIANASKVEKYPKIVKNLSKIYNSPYSVSIKNILAHKRGEDTKTRRFLVSKIKTNNPARKKAGLDVNVLTYLDNKKIINLEKDAKKLSMSKKEFYDSIKRLNKISKLISANDCVREVNVK